MADGRSWAGCALLLQARGVRRCQHSQRASRARGESTDSPLRHAWAENQRPATAPAAGGGASAITAAMMRQAPYERPASGSLYAPAGLRPRFATCALNLAPIKYSPEVAVQSIRISFIPRKP